ncbi:MAG: UDP-N-acetylmuramoyl-L-alanine--D-glutamate ligase [Colwellia sp.]
MTLLATLKHKQILVLGAGLTGLSCVRFLHAQDLCFAVNDSRAMPFANDDSQQQFEQDFPNATLVLGEWDKALIAQAEVILISPGIDLVATGINQYIPCECDVIGDVELFCRINNEQENPISILAVTGSNGKSTVVSLLDHIAKSLNVNAQLGGNIGKPVLDLLTAKNDDLPELLIVELSSFQLETLSSMKAVGASVLNVSDDHLDRHITFANYQAIKEKIYQQADIAIVNRDDKATNPLSLKQKIISFGSDIPAQGHFGLADIVCNECVSKKTLMFGAQALIAIDELPLAGIHNALNYLATLALGYSAGWPISDMLMHLKDFSGLSHRCQRVSSQDDICWINDSKATNVGATLAAINGLAQTLPTKSQLILIAGGDGKGADFSPLQAPINNYVSLLITLGKDGDKIAKLTEITQASTSINTPVNTIKVNSMGAAVQLANTHANNGDIVLLSPACASLDMFKNFVQRGDSFVSAVKQLAKES